MKKFLDMNGNKVELSFEKGSFAEPAAHVLVLCEYEGKWLLTLHAKRGLEFPGGKVEPGESLFEAAAREVAEETGAVLGNLEWFAEYKVHDPDGAFVKAVFLASVQNLERRGSYFETLGPKLVDGDLEKLRFGDEYSYIMKDEVVGECLARIRDAKENK